MKLYNWLLKNKEIKLIKREYKPHWCSTEYIYRNKGKIKKGKYPYRFDFLLTFNNKKQLIIELDGRQHYEQVSNWTSPLHNQIRDKYKEFKARQHNLDVIRIFQEDVYYEKNNWKSSLRKILKEYQ